MSQSAASDTVSIAVASESLVFLGSALSMTRDGESAGRLADAAARVSMSSEILREAMLVLPSVFILVLGSLLLAAMGGLAPVFPLMALPVVPPPSAAASAGVGLVTAAAAAAAARDEVAVAAAYDGAAGVFCGCWAARWGWRLGGMMTEIYFNDLTARVGVATVAEEVTGLVLGSVTNIRIDILGAWNRLETDGSGLDLILTEISFNDLTARVGMATVGVKVNGLVLETVAVMTLIRLGIKDAITRPQHLGLTESVLGVATVAIESVTATVIDLYV